MRLYSVLPLLTLTTAMYGGQSPYRLDNQSQHLAIEFQLDGVRLQHPDGNSVFRLISYGYESQLLHPEEAIPVRHGDSIEYRRGGLTEWYKSDARGIEQGFTLERRPGVSRNGEPLRITMSVEGGLQPAAGANDSSVYLGTALRYGGLRSWDSLGRDIPTHLQVQGREIRLIVDDRDAKYPLVVDPFWTQQAKLTGSPGTQMAKFGAALSISGDTAIIGAPGSESAFVFVRSGGTWIQQQQLTPPDGAGGESFGFSVSISGDTAVVGSMNHSVGGNFDQGAAYVYVRSGTTWTLQQELSASDGRTVDHFGYSVSISGNTIAVGAYNKTLINQYVSSGAVYMYVRNGGPPGRSNKS